MGRKTAVALRPPVHTRVYSCNYPTQRISKVVTRMTGHSAKAIGYGLDLQTFHPALSGENEVSAGQKWNLPWMFHCYSTSDGWIPINALVTSCRLLFRP